ncbi:hypothetical protein HLASA_0595 [Halanaeroarchaeum sulfurireducens]|uniref:Uncharacterized protein n=1 Tax=Halanaeroarchaeum sulfurireducens TaxID=1604004 RepID=A0A0N9N374_9EURY|nr:hypothetical protein HLASA_0595 [Halanaeroarchaeum sulfurireducens]
MVAVTIVSDDRGRVPFALIAALLLVSSLTFASGLVHEASQDPVSPRLVETSTQEARIQLGSVARAADRAAAAEPVLSPGQTQLGRVIADDPFERALELRIAVRASQRVAATRAAGRTTVRVSAPPITDEAAARRALREVDITHLEDERYRVVLENVSVVATRDGHVVERDVLILETTVALPSMTVHQRARTFERRLTADITDPGLNRGLTARLFALAWVRGYAQYGDAPISNVVATRHVGVLTNDALVDQQVAAFGRADPESQRGVARAAADVAVVDGVGGLESLVTSAADPANGSEKPGRAASLDAVEMPSVVDDPQEFDVGQGADRAFVDFADGSGLDQAVRSAYRTSIRPETSASFTGYDERYEGERPENGTRRFSYTTSDRTVTGDDRAAGYGSTVLRYDRTVAVTRTEHTFWTVNRSFAGTTSVARERTYDVSVDVECRYDRPDDAPSARMTRTCPFGEPARAALERESAEAMSTRFGGVDSVAADAATGYHWHGWRTVTVDPPPGARERAYGSAAALRDEVRGIDVEMPPASMASKANPASRLEATIRRRHDSLVDAPRYYDSAATVAEYAARDAYLDALRGDLADQSSAIAGMQDGLGDVMASNAVPGAPPDDEPEALSPIAASVSAEPRYLSLSAQRGSPNLAARNVNLFTVPYGDAADVVGGAIGGDDDSASLSSATNTLVATNRALESADDPQLRARRDRLRGAIRSSIARVRVEQRSALRIGTDLSRREATAVIDAGYDRHDSVASRARAVSDGSIAEDIAASLPPSTTASVRDRALVEVRVATTDARGDETVRVSESVVQGVAERVRPHVREGVEQAVRVGTDRAASMAKRRTMRSAAAKMPAGLPLTPVPGQWYATANVWVVSVKGGYDRFVVDAPRASPTQGNGGTIQYVRESDTVSLDVDGDGHEEIVGLNEPIELATTTGVFVVVPPGPAGVGDTNGDADERSSGW